MNKINATNTASNTRENVMPMPLDYIKGTIKNGYNEQKDKSYMKFLQSDLYKMLKPYVDKAIADDNYEGSPIFNGYVDRDTIGSIVDKAIYYAMQEHPNIEELVQDVDTSGINKSILLRAVVQNIVLDEIFYTVRPNHKGDIKYENIISDQMVPENELPTDFISPEMLPMPLDNIAQ